MHSCRSGDPISGASTNKNKMNTPFRKSSTAPGLGGSTNANSRESRVLKPELRDRIFPHWKGSSWVRLLPAIEGGKTEGYLIKVPLITRGNITAVCPSVAGQRSLFREAHQAIKNAPEGSDIAKRRYHKDTNPNGVRCWPVDHWVGWVLGIDPAATRFEILCVNANDGSFGPAQLGHKILTQAAKVDTDPSLPPDQRGRRLYEDVSSITSGHHLNITKQGEGKSSTYEAQFSNKPTDITALITALPQDEIAKLCPIDQALHIPTIEEQLEILQALFGKEYVALLLPEFA